MPAAVFVIQLDDMQGFLVKKRYPSTFSLNEKILNLVYYSHFQGGNKELQIHEIEDRRIATFGTQKRQGWLVCFILGDEEDFGPYRDLYAGMGRLILELAVENPELLDIGDIIRNKSVIEEPTMEQRCAEIILTPSSLLLLERLQERGLDRSASLAVWLREQVQAEEVEIIEAIRPLMDTGVVHVEIIQKTAEIVFLLMDIFAFRSPPVKALQYAESNMPEIVEMYRQLVKEFFAPSPPAKGYNPTSLSDDPNAPIVEDRTKIAAIMSKTLTYTVIKHLRERPLTVDELADQTALPKTLVNKILWTLESERMAICINENIWILITDPVIETFMPEYVLPVIKQRYAEKEIGENITVRYLELLTERWSET